MKITWTFHNRVIHPLCALLRWVGMTRRALVLHDAHMPAEIDCILWDRDGMTGTIVGKKENGKIYGGR